jgi:shikimate dehydrogenase
VSAPLKLAVLGDPLSFTLSPVLHRAGLEALGLEGESSALPTPAARLAERLAALAAGGWRGANLTHPLKQAVIDHLDRVSEAARLARAVNTVGFEADGRWGETTDGGGFLELLARLGRDPARERVVLFGGGGAARSLALALLGGGCRDVVAGVREPERARGSWAPIPGARLVPLGGEEADRLVAGEATLAVNCTPLDDERGPCAPGAMHPAMLLIDLVYGPAPTAWVRAARARGMEAHDGLGLLVFQARRSLSLWTGRDVPLEPLARAVGWPR